MKLVCCCVGEIVSSLSSCISKRHWDFICIEWLELKSAQESNMSFAITTASCSVMKVRAGARYIFLPFQRSFFPPPFLYKGCAFPKRSKGEHTTLETKLSTDVIFGKIRCAATSNETTQSRVQRLSIRSRKAYMTLRTKLSCCIT
jgi:hypothetical protein